MFKKILHANDGSEHAFNALALALKIAKQSGAELHMISVEEIDYLPETMEDVREETLVAGRRFHTVINRSRAMACSCNATRSAAATNPWVGSTQAVGQRVIPLVRINSATASQ